MSVEDLVEWMFFLEAFIDDAEELSTKVGFNIRIERRIVPYIYIYIYIYTPVFKKVFI